VCGTLGVILIIMLKQVRIIFTVLSFTILFSTCNKDEDDSNTLYHGKINSKLRSFLFDIGSYWIYKDSITSNLDSTVVMSITKDVFALFPKEPGQGSPGDEEYFKINYSSYPASISYSEEIIASLISRGYIYGGVTYIASNNVGSTILNAKLEKVIDSINIEGLQYHNVIKMRIEADEYFNSNYNFYYVDSIGIIRKEKMINETISDSWNLLRYSTSIKPY